MERITGLSHTYLSTLEKGFDPRSKKPRHPTPEVLKKIADTLEESDYELLFEKAGYLYDQTPFLEKTEKLIETMNKRNLLKEKEKVKLVTKINEAVNKDEDPSIIDKLNEELNKVQFHLNMKDDVNSFFKRVIERNTNTIEYTILNSSFSGDKKESDLKYVISFEMSAVEKVVRENDTELLKKIPKNKALENFYSIENLLSLSDLVNYNGIKLTKAEREKITSKVCEMIRNNK